jgi:hypothetical protein
MILSMVVLGLLGFFLGVLGFSVFVFSLFDDCDIISYMSAMDVGRLIIIILVNSELIK